MSDDGTDAGGRADGESGTDTGARADGEPGSGTGTRAGGEPGSDTGAREGTESGDSANAGSGDGAEGGGRTMTLAFTLDALKALRDPAGATDEARAWSDHVGIVADEPESVVRNYAKRHRVRQDFFPNAMAKRNALVAVQQQFPTARHVLVGTTVDDRAVATETGWEYRPVAEAAEKAGWALADGYGEDDDGDGSLVGSVRDRLSRLF